MTFTPQHVFNETSRRFWSKTILAIKNELRNDVLLSIVLYLILPSLYVLAIMNNLDSFQSIILIGLGIITGMFTVGRMGIKFFKELKEVIMDYRKDNITIEGAKWFFIILAIAVLIIIVGLVLIFIYVSSKQS